MFHLNSVIIEGLVTSKDITTIDQAKKGTGCHFNVESLGADKDQEDVRQEVFTNATILLNDYQARRTKALIHYGKQVRVVGKLRERKDDDPESLPDLYIVGEHVEIKGA